MRNYIYVIFIVVATFFACQQSPNQANKVELRLNNDLDICDIFSNVEVIPLEDLDNAVVDQLITKTILHNNYIYILNPRLTTIFIFDQNGRFINKLEKGVGPNEFFNALDINVNRFTGNLEVLTRNRIMIYDSMGETMISSERIETPHLPTRFYNIDSQTDVLFCKYADQKLVYYNRTNNSIINSIYELPTYIYDSPLGFNTTPFYFYNDTVRLLQGYNGDVFSLCPAREKLSMLKYVEWDFGINKFSYQQIEAKTNIVDYINECSNVSKQTPLGFLSYGENNKYLFTQFWYAGKPVSMIYNKKNGESEIFESFKGGIKFSFFHVDDEYCYLLVPACDITEVVNKKMLETYLIELPDINEESNPIFIKYKFKK